MNISYLANGGGNLKASSVLLMLLRRAQRKLFIFIPIGFVAMFAALTFCACTEEERLVRDPETRALSPEDSVQQELVIDINTTWDGEDSYEY